MQIKTMLINLLIPVSSGENMKKRKQEILLHCWYKVNWYSIYENKYAVLKNKTKQKLDLTYYPAIILLDTYLKEIKFWSQEDIWIAKSTVALFAIAETWKQPCVRKCIYG